MSDTTPRTDKWAKDNGLHAGVPILTHVYQLEKELTESEKAREGMLQNVGSCGACAEGLLCGSTMYQHEGCVFAERDELRSRLAAAESALAETRKEYQSFQEHEMRVQEKLVKAESALKAAEEDRKAAEEMLDISEKLVSDLKAESQSIRAALSSANRRLANLGELHQG